MNLGPNPVNTTYQYLLNQSGTNITLGNNGSVNWNGANVVTRTGNQTIAGAKTFTSNIAAISFGNEASDNYFGHGATSSNSFGNNSQLNYFGYDASLNYFGGNATNYFGDTASTNYFGGNTTNSFGDNGDINSFGDDAADNSFGSFADNNDFGSNSTVLNIFGVDAISNKFGNSLDISYNEFGVGAVRNIFGGGSFYSPIALFLQEFSGPSSQSGQFGELRVNGSGLYVCTGTTGGWGRTFLQSF